MLVRMRNASQGWIAKFVAGVIIVVLTIFGFGAFNLFAVNEPAVATVNGEDITERRLAGQIENSKQRFRSTYGDSISEAQLDEFVNEEFALRQLIDMELFMQASRDLDLTLSDLAFERVLRNDPQFQTESGAFDEELLRETLERGGLSVQTLRGLQEDASVRSQLLRVIEDTAFSTASETRLSAKFDKQVRDISVLEFDLDQFKESDSVTGEDVASYYELNTDLYMSEGTFDFEYVELKRHLFVSDTELSEEEIQDLYDADVAARESNAKRRGRHLLIKIDDNRSDEEALTLISEIRGRIDAGESLGELAKELSEDEGSKRDGGDLGFSEREQWVREFSDSLWSLELNEISPPVKTSFGYHLIELLEVEELDLPSLEQRREALVEEHRLALATDSLKEALTEVDRLAFEQSDSLQPIVDEFGVEINEILAVDRFSNDGVFATQSVRNAFMESDVIDNGFNSRVVEIGDTSIIVGRLSGRTEPTLRPFETVSDEIREKLAEEAAIAARDTKLDSVMTQLLDDRNYDAASLAAGSDWVVYERQKRDDFTVDPAVLEAAFAKPLPVDGERVIVSAESEFTPTKYIVTASRQDLADYALLDTTEQNTLMESSQNEAKVLATSAFVASLRSEASIKTELIEIE
ncbi:MAG: SurA N-terminal domain-containing protein [Gammaproteobacteria bacterium]|nr:SurA N-terminal domain-containing protein [Gammaproteobacteria bacterium]